MSIRSHGGAVRYWRHRIGGNRAVLCADGALLMLRGGRWRETRLDAVERDPEWQDDTSQAMAAAITRTGREARRRVQREP